MNSRNTIILGAFSGLTAVILGASGAHALKPMLTRTGMYEVYHLAVEYQFYHTLALLATGILMYKRSSIGMLKYAPICFFIGILCFSGSLYMLALTELRGFGPVTPIGGVFLITGWALLLISFLRKE